MTSLELRFSSELILERTVFRSTLLEKERIAVRGKGASVLYPHSFQWTSAVQGFAMLIIATAIEQEGLVRIIGGQGSLTASLDLALSKRPQWLSDIFGNDKKGSSLALRCFQRTNPERKRGGEVGIHVNRSFLSNDTISIYLNSERLAGEALAEALDKLTSQLGSPSDKVEIFRESSTSTDLDDLFVTVRNLYLREIEQSLSTLEPFSRRNAQQASLELSGISLFSRILGRKRDLILTSLANMPQSSIRLGISDYSNLNGLIDPIKISLPGLTPQVYALFLFLKHVRSLPIEIDYRYGYAIEISKRILTDPSFRPDLCILGSAPTATLLSSLKTREYEPLMYAPRFSHKTMGKRTTLIDRVKRFLFLQDEPSTSRFYYDSLVEKGGLSGEKISLEHWEPDEIGPELLNADSGTEAILFFPHYDLNQMFNGLDIFHERDIPLQNQLSVILASERVARTEPLRKSIESAIRDAWLTLSQNSTYRHQVVNLMLGDDEYKEFFLRSTGVRFMKDLRSKN